MHCWILHVYHDHGIIVPMNTGIHKLAIGVQIWFGTLVFGIHFLLF